jgi:hypothetical protein
MTLTFSEDDLAAMAAAIKQHLSDCRAQLPMTYILSIGPWHVGPFSTHTAAQHFAETHGLDDFRMIELDDPAEAPGKIHRAVRPPNG